MSTSSSGDIDSSSSDSDSSSLSSYNSSNYSSSSDSLSSSSDSSSSYSSTSDDSDSYQSVKKRARHDSFANGKAVDHDSFANGKAVDRISELPDAILLHILSFLQPADAVRSGVLSKRFDYLWTHLDRLEFVNSHPKFIDVTLNLHNRLNLQKFSIIYQNRRHTPSAGKLNRWIRALFRHCPLKDLTLKFEKSHYMLPQHFYSNSSLIKLNLLGCEISSKGSINWESIQSLIMSNSRLTNFRIADILSGCPSMEFLEFSKCCGFTQIGPIINKCLKKLVVRDYRAAGATLVIFAPYLQSFVLSGKTNIVKCKVLSSNALTNCCLDFRLELYDRHQKKDKSVNMLTSLLHDVCHVRDVITMGEWGLQVLALIEKDGLPFPMLESRVKCLELDTNLTAAVMAGIKFLLRSLNCLEKLSITKSGAIDNRLWFRSENLCLGSKDMESDVNLNLKTVEISGFGESDSKNGAEVLALVKFLLKNAVYLEKVTLKLSHKWTQNVSLLEKLLSLPRSSPRAVVIILQ